MKPTTVRRRRTAAKCRILMDTIRVGLLGVVLTSLTVSQTQAQAPSKSLDIQGVVGLAGFLDEATDYSFLIGGTVRRYVSPRVAVEPEFIYIRQTANHEDFLLQANIVRDFAGSDKIQPYLIGGMGLLHHRSKHPGALRPMSTNNALTGGGGAGVRIRLGDRFFISPEFRIGTEPLFRASISFGATFQR